MESMDGLKGSEAWMIIGGVLGGYAEMERRCLACGSENPNRHNAE